LSYFHFGWLFFIWRAGGNFFVIIVESAEISDANADPRAFARKAGWRVLRILGISPEEEPAVPIVEQFSELQVEQGPIRRLIVSPRQPPARLVRAREDGHFPSPAL